MTDMMLLTKQGGILKPFATVLGWIIEGIFWVLNKLSIPNIGLTIILITFIIYLLLLPLTIKQQKFSKLSAKMSPELNAIRSKYQGKNDQESMQKMNMETQAIYSKYGVSPTGSCVQLLIQCPILFALYRVINNMPAYITQIKDAYTGVINGLMNKADASTVIQSLSGAAGYTKQFNNESFGLLPEYTSNTYIDVLNKASTGDWDLLKTTYPDLTQNINNTLSQLDRFNNFFGLNVANSPAFNVKTQWDLSSRNWGIIIFSLLIPLLVYATQWINTKLMPQPDTGNKKKGEEDAMASSMKTMNLVFPLMTAFLSYTLPFALGLYWISGSVIRSIIQILINKKIDKIDIDEMVKANVEKMNAKRAKIGLPPQQLVTNATINTKKIENRNEKSYEEREKEIKESTEYYKNANIGKEGSLASKAFMVKQYNEKNNKND